MENSGKTSKTAGKQMAMDTIGKEKETKKSTTSDIREDKPPARCKHKTGKLFMKCPECDTPIFFHSSSRIKRPKIIAYLLCFFLAFLGCWCGCCLVPCCFKECYNFYYVCPRCKMRI
ncbi:Hypothetical predicted protein [Cloeon dipterum]|uniref:LITAF domain-containing protein n=1 Tax=Cloeon dipterum TaxID=197152 RepID=A0A8S1DP57_9INSE|nr:Hypothetical predicted protein [Cloeon dipterum]